MASKRKPNSSVKPRANGPRMAGSKQPVRKPGKLFQRKRDEESVPPAQQDTQVKATGINNDPEWYKNIPGLAEAYASLPFNIPTGTSFNPFALVKTPPVDGYPSIGTMARNPYTTRVISGILIFDIMPTIGKCQTPVDAANLAAQQVYALNRQQNSGAKNYDKTEQFMVTLAMDSAYMLYEDMFRGYKLINQYSAYNRYLPDGLITGLGFHPTLQSELEDWKGLLNQFAALLASIPVPDQFDFIRRHSWMFSNVYKDAGSIKAQMYAFKPHGFYVWDEGRDNKTTSLVYHQRSSFTADGYFATVSEMRDAMFRLMDPLLGSEDVGIISGDLLKAFGADGMIKIAPVTGDALSNMLEPVYSTEVLNQIMNMDIVEGLVNYEPIHQNLSNLTSGPFLQQDLQPAHNAGNLCLASLKKLVNLHVDSPTVDECLVSTRLKVTTEINSSGRLVFTSYGTEICLGCQIITPNLVEGSVAPGWKAVSLRQHLIDYATTTTDTDVTLQRSQYETNLALVCQHSQFDWAPTLYQWRTEGLPATGAIDFTYYGYHQDIDNYNWFNNSDIEQLNDMCVLSLFTCKAYRGK